MTLSSMFNKPLGELFGRKPAVAAPVSTARPRVGATICCSQFRMTVPVGFNEDLWQWLSAQGWRPMAEKENRYRYRALASNVVAALVDAPVEQREKLLSLALRRAADQATTASQTAQVA
jgi:hypothetical protein